MGLDTICASLAFVVFGDIFCSLEWVTDIDSESGVGKTRWGLFK
jgi:hypothetical protein